MTKAVEWIADSDIECVSKNLGKKSGTFENV